MGIININQLNFTKSIGIARKVDHLGRIVLPKELRDSLGLDKNTTIEMYVEDNLIYIKKYCHGCFFCESIKDVVEYKDKTICKSCIYMLKEL